MSNSPKVSKKHHLRQQAEVQAQAARGGQPPTLSPKESQHTLHELLVHQIELEMQNEELRQSQGDLNTSQARYFDLYDLAPVGYLTVSEKGLVQDANLTATTLLGLTRGELLQQPLTHFILPADQDIFYLHRLQLFKTGAPQTCELRMLKNAGTAFWTHLAAVLAQNAKGEPVCRIVITDITPRKHAEALLQQAHEELEKRVADRTRELQEANELIKLFMIHSPIYAYIKELTPTASRVLMASENFQDMLGIPGSKMVGKTMAELFPADFATKITADDWAVVSSGKMLKLDEDLNGRHYTTIKFPITRNGKNLLAGYTLDITDRKQAELEREKLLVQNQQLQKTESLGRMAGAIAHHFNNQLAAVMLNLDSIISGYASGEGPVLELSEAMSAARKAAEVSTQMLTYLGLTPGHQEPLELSEVCRHHLTLLRATMSSNVTLDTHFATPGPVISANPNQIQQVMTNLVTNACEALTEDHGTIHLTVHTVTPNEIPSAHRFPIDWQPQAPAYAYLQVTDEGCGIAPQDIEKLFDPFFSHKFTGRGLGLSVVLGIVRTHQGVITVESKLHHGSTFRVFLPVTGEAVSQQPKPAVPVPCIAGGGTVLVVEDEAILRHVVARALSKSGFTVLTATDGFEAVELFRKNAGKIRLVLCDLTMPRMNGWQTLEALRKIAPTIPVILSSGYSETHALAGHHAELPQAFLSKPYVFEELRSTIASVLEKAGR